jgi:hypothetical protein
MAKDMQLARRIRGCRAPPTPAAPRKAW